MRLLRLIIWVISAAPMMLACSFRYEPAAAVQFYRAEGWMLPGTNEPLDGLPRRIYPPPAVWNLIPGATPEVLQHEYPFIIEFPAQKFELGGAPKNMRRLVAKATIVRWNIGGRVVAYSYNLIPLSARRKNGKWVIKAEMGCIFPATFIDDRDDGVFRLLVERDLTPDLIPDWARQMIDSAEGHSPARLY